MGLGFEENIRWNRAKLKAAAEERLKKQEDGSILPVYMKYLLDTNPGKFRKLYPKLAEALELTLYAGEENSSTKEEAFQYPYQQFTTEGEQHLPGTGDTEGSARKKMDTILQARNAAASRFIEELESRAGEAYQEEIEDLRKELWRTNYGTADPNIAPSTTPCCGCGAFLHCSDSAIPGFMPAEVFKGLDGEGLRSHLCQRCLYLQHYDTALNVKVDCDTYPRILAEIREKKALALLMVDLTDLPCSLWRDVKELLGPKKPVLVVVNKLDLLPCDNRGYLERVRACVEQNLKDVGLSRGGNVKGVCLVSAKTGYGVEDLITRLHDVWRSKGDIYLIGCTNVGKSTLFNTLLQSDLCQQDVTDLVQRATTSAWPGTTLNLLKFPILRPSGWQLHTRLRRLASQKAQLYQEMGHRKQLYYRTNQPQYATLIGRIGMTFKKQDRGLFENTEPPTSIEKIPRSDTHYCYDTPGAVYEDQILDLLTLEELLKVMPKEIITPRTFLLRPNQSLFLAGLGRIDLLSEPSSKHIFVTVFASKQLPVHVVDTPDADDFYRDNLGGSLLGVPLGPPNRIADFPALRGKDLEFEGTGWDASCGDVVLSSAGWASLTLNRDEPVNVRAWTPGGRGIHRRVPAMLPGAVLLRGQRIKGTPAYKNNRCTVW